MPNILIIGATRGLGASLVNQYARQEGTIVYGTTRSAEPPKKGLDERIVWVKSVDVSERDVGERLVSQLDSLVGGVKGFDVVVSYLHQLWKGRDYGLMRRWADHHSGVFRNGGLERGPEVE
jgi:NAD(P)-dependent dehydrogenase (short-subunit alcohol dehydrogenase family)